MKSSLSLRSALAAITILVTALAVLVAGALVVFTNTLSTTTTNIGKSLESVHLALDAETALLLYERSEDALVRRDIEGNLQHGLIEAKRFITSDEEAQALAEASTQVGLYLSAFHNPQKTPDERATQQEAAYGALEALVSINLAQSKDDQGVAQHWDKLGNAIGIGFGAILVLAAGAILIWLRWWAFEPLFRLASAMGRFGRGERDARAPESGLHELREMCSRFNEMASSIAAQRQAQMAFLGGIAHDLRTPLSGLKLSAALLGHSKLPPERIQQTTERIDRQIIRMERMLNDFLDVAKIEAGQLDLRFDTHDARRLVEEVIELFKGATAEHSIELQLPAEPVLIHCDQLRIEQVLINLLSNALKYSPPGSAVEIKLTTHKQELSLCVTDHGVGISQEDLPRIFEPFRRVGLSKEAIPGVGLGLFVVRTLVEAHQGRIEVKSTPGHGSAFCVFLPIQNHLNEANPTKKTLPPN